MLTARRWLLAGLAVMAAVFLAQAAPAQEGQPDVPLAGQEFLEAGMAGDALEWQAVNAGLESPFALWFAPEYAASGRIWAAASYTLQEVGYGYGPLYRSSDRGASWERRSPATRTMRLAAFAPSGAADPLILALESYQTADLQPAQRLVRSTDGGASWQTVWDNCPPMTLLVFSPNFAVDGIVFAVWDDTMYLAWF